MPPNPISPNVDVRVACIYCSSYLSFPIIPPARSGRPKMAESDFFSPRHFLRASIFMR